METKSLVRGIGCDSVYAGDDMIDALTKYNKFVGVMKECNLSMNSLQYKKINVSRLRRKDANFQTKFQL